MALNLFRPAVGIVLNPTKVVATLRLVRVVSALMHLVLGNHRIEWLFMISAANIFQFDAGMNIRSNIS